MNSFNDSYNRYVFRREISNFFNSDAVWRKTKGQTTGVFQRSLVENRDYILELCLNGFVAKAGLIKSKILEKYISRISKGLTDYQWSLIHLLCYEIFVGCWQSLL